MRSLVSIEVMRGRQNEPAHTHAHSFTHIVTQTKSIMRKAYLFRAVPEIILRGGGNTFTLLREWDVCPKVSPMGDGCRIKSVLGIGGALAGPGHVKVTPNSSEG